MGIAYQHCFVLCPNTHMIPVPHSSLSEIDGSPRRLATDIPKVAVVCPECGDVSAYSIRDMKGGLVPDKPNRFQAGECRLVSIEVECDGENCKAPKVIHVIVGDEKGIWRPLVGPKNWRVSDSARCKGGHNLRFENRDKTPPWTNLNMLPW
jgi:hypothetical protein